MLQTITQLIGLLISCVICFFVGYYSGITQEKINNIKENNYVEQTESKNSK